MGEMMKTLLSLSFSGTVLFLIVFLVVRSESNRLSRRWQYYIWLLVVLRFLVPLTFTNTLTGYLFRGAEQSVKTSSDDTVRSMETAGTPPAGMTENGGKQDNATGSLTESTEKDSVTEKMPMSGVRPGLSFWLFFAWSAGAFGLLIYKITVYQSYMRFLKKGNAEVSDLTTLNLLAEAEEKLGIQRTVELYRNPMISSPVMTGGARPRIVIPDRKITEKELTCIFTHELVHFKYCDLCYKWLVQITICIHWFNPVVWILGKEINKRCELACDEKVIGSLDAAARRDYGDTLLSFLERGEAYQSPTAAVTLTEGAEQLIERLGAIMDYRKKSKMVVILTTALTVVLCFFFSGIGAYAGQRDSEREGSGTERDERGVNEGIPEEEDSPSMDDMKIGKSAEEEPEDPGQEAMEQTEKRYAYYQRSRYEEPYIIEFGWNLSEEDEQSYTHTEILLEDQSRMTVCFAKEAEKWMEDAAAMEAVTRLLGETKQIARSRFGLEMERPYIVRVINLPPEEIGDFARRAFENEDIADFCIVVELLSEEEKVEYCEKSHEKNAIDFFSVIISEMEADYVKDFVEKSYERNEMDYFSVAAGYLPEPARKALMKRALAEKREDFYYVLKNVAD